VVAYRSTGVPYAMGGAGVLVSAKRYDLIAELIELLVRDEEARGKLLAGQRRRLQELAPGQFASTLRDRINQMSA
jgi:hypothetical protein